VLGNFSANAAEKMLLQHIVKKGETLSQILYDYHLRPIYPTDGYLDEVLSLNHLDLERTKKLEIGDVLVLPITKSYLSLHAVRNNYILKKDLPKYRKTIVKHIYPKTNLAKIKKDRHLVSFDFDYFARIVDLGGGGKVEILQNLGVGANYKYRDVTIQKNYTFNVGAQLYGHTQSEAKFKLFPELGASFTPNVKGQLFVEFEHRPMLVYVRLIGEMEYMSTVDWVNDNFEVRRDIAGRGGLGLSKEFDLGKAILDINGEFLITVLSNPKGNQGFSAKMHGKKIKLGGGIRFFNSLRLGGWVENDTFSESIDKTMLSMGAGVNYLF